MSKPPGTTVDPRVILPARPLHPRAPIHSMWGGGFLLPLALMVGFLVYCAGWIAPVLMTDGLVRATAVPIVGGHLAEGSCSSHAFVRMCDLTLTVMGPSGLATRNIHYLFGTVSLGGDKVRVVGDPAHPAWLTTDLGLDYFWNRLASLAVAVAFLGTLLTVAGHDLARTARLRAWWHRATMAPVALTLANNEARSHDAVWTVRAGSGREVAWTVPKNAIPFFLAPPDCILGLMQEGNICNILPLDVGLRWVVLSAEERAAAFAMVTT